jgi:uncharacterized protein YjbJ (UPF0337 family)
MADDDRAPNEDVGKAKEFIGEVTGDQARAAEGRAEREAAQGDKTLKESVDEAILGASGEKPGS